MTHYGDGNISHNLVKYYLITPEFAKMIKNNKINTNLKGITIFRKK